MKILALDYGKVRIGLAYGINELKIAHPLSVITGKNKLIKLEQIIKLIDIWEINLVVCGMPSVQKEYFDPQKDILIKEINNFATQLESSTQLTVKFVTEDFSSYEASTRLKQMNLKIKQQKNILDMIAACVILENYWTSNDFC